MITTKTLILIPLIVSGLILVGAMWFSLIDWLEARHDEHENTDDARG